MFIMDPVDARSCFDLIYHHKESEVVLNDINGRASQRWIFDPPLNEDFDQTYRIKSCLNGLYLDVNSHNKLTLTNTSDKMWQIRKEHHESGVLFCMKIKKYLERNSDKKLIFQSYMGTRWKWVIGRY